MERSINGLSYKAYGRIYVKDKNDIERVKSIIKTIDPFEFDYLPDGMITTFDEYPKVIYTHKFNDLNFDLLNALCMRMGIQIWIFDSGRNEYTSDELKEFDKKHNILNIAKKDD